MEVPLKAAVRRPAKRCGSSQCAFYSRIAMVIFD
jgi:hypothetical protein